MRIRKIISLKQAASKNLIDYKLIDHGYALIHYLPIKKENKRDFQRTYQNPQVFRRDLTFTRDLMIGDRVREWQSRWSFWHGLVKNESIWIDLLLYLCFCMCLTRTTIVLWYTYIHTCMDSRPALFVKLIFKSTWDGNIYIYTIFKYIVYCIYVISMERSIKLHQDHKSTSGVWWMMTNRLKNSLHHYAHHLPNPW